MGTKIREYPAAGGTVTDDDRIMALLKLLPKELAEDLLMEMSSLGSFLEPREHVKTRCELMTSCKGKTPGIRVAENDDFPDTYGEPIGIATGDLEGVDEHILAMISKATDGRLRFAKGKGKCKGKALGPKLVSIVARHAIRR